MQDSTIEVIINLFAAMNSLINKILTILMLQVLLDGFILIYIFTHLK